MSETRAQQHWPISAHTHRPMQIGLHFSDLGQYRCAILGDVDPQYCAMPNGEHFIDVGQDWSAVLADERGTNQLKNINNKSIKINRTQLLCFLALVIFTLIFRFIIS